MQDADAVRSQPPPDPDPSLSWLRAFITPLPYAMVVFQAGTDRRLFANDVAVRFRLDEFVTQALDGECHDLPARTEGLHFPVDENGKLLSSARNPACRAIQGEQLQGERFLWHTPAGNTSFLAYTSNVGLSSERFPALTVLSFVEVTSLESARAELDAAVQARDELLSVATHELRDPLNSLLLSLQFVKMLGEQNVTLPSRDVLEQVELCLRQGGRLVRLVDNLLDMSRIVNDRVQLDLELVDVGELVEELSRQLQGSARVKGTSLAVRCDAPVRGNYDRIKLEQVVGNLISNAIKYGGNQAIEIVVHADSGAALIDVRDHGPGIAPHDQQRIFERFQRAADNHTRQSLGLGLYIARSFVVAHGGSIRLRSAPGQGSTFTVELPLNAEPASPG